MATTTSKAGDPTLSTSQPHALWQDGPLHITAGSESLDTQLIRSLQEKHLLDDSQVAFLPVTVPSVLQLEHVFSQPSQILLDRETAIDGKSGEGEDTQTSDIVDFSSLLETQARRASTAGNHGGRNEPSLNREIPNKEELHGKEGERTSTTSDKDRAIRPLDDKHQSRHSASDCSKENPNDSKQQPRTYIQRSTTSAIKHGKGLNRPTKHSMDDWQPSDANIGEPDGSPTQKNNSLAYGDIHMVSSSPVPGHDDELPLQTNLDPTASARSYDENETGGVRFSFTTSKVHVPVNRESSIGIDEGFTVHEAPMELEPETPAPPENPFAKSKPPLQGTQLFNNTQSSPVDPHVLESGSSRPSPGMLGFGVQSSRNRILSSVTDRFQQASYHPPGDLSSPLLHNAKSSATNRFRDNEANVHRLPDFTSPLYRHGSKTPASASYRGHILVADETPIPRASKNFQHRVISFNKPEPHEYVSREESQQRRLQKQAQVEDDSDSEEDSFERDQAIRAKQRKIREDAAKELAQVSVTRAPKEEEEEEEEVEVPATGQKRRSVSQEYVAQCYGADARDTQTSTQIHNSIKAGENNQDDTQGDTQAEMTIVDSQVPTAAPIETPSPSDRSSRQEKGPILPNDGFNLTNQSNTPSTDPKPQGAEMLPPLPALDNNSDTESAHRESSMSPRTRVPRTSSGRLGKSGLPQTPGRLSQHVVMSISTAEDMVPETSPAKSDYKLFDMDDSPEPSLVSIGGIGFTQDDPEYDAIASPIRDLAMKRGVRGDAAKVGKSNIAASKKGAISNQARVVFSGGSGSAALSSSLPVIPSIKPIIAAPSQKIPSSADNLQSADMDAPDSSPVRPATRRAARKACQASGVVFDTKRRLNDSQGSEDDVVMINPQKSVSSKSVSPIRQSVETEGNVLADTTELLPCPFYSADKPCNVKDHQAYYHDEEIRQMYLKKHRPTAPIRSSGIASSDIPAAGSKDSVSLPSTQHSGKAEEISPHPSTTANPKSSENIPTGITRHDSNLGRSASSSLSELSSEYDNDEFFTAVMDSSNTRDREGRSRSRGVASDASGNGTPARDSAESMPPPSVRRKLSFPQGPLTASQTKSRDQEIQSIKAVKAAEKAKISKSIARLSAQSPRSNSRSSRRTVSTTDVSEEGSSIIVERTPIRPQRPARSTRRASINYDTESDSSRSSSPDILVKEHPKLPKAVDLQKVTNPTLFANMAFAISYKGDTAQDISDRSAVTRLIKTHGGRLLDGFNDLFTDGPTSLLTTPSTATKQPKQPLLSHKNKQIGELALAPAAQDLGFVAFIGDHYTRKSKFVQALALGLPCLSGRWVTTCVTRGRIVPFLPFLLAAGESSYLGGAVRSRLLAPYDPSTARFDETFARREKLLGGKRVIFLMGRGKAEERKRAYLFLTRALGAGEVRRVASVREAREVVEEGGGWDLVYVDDDRKVAGAEAEILGGVDSGAKPPKGKAKGKAGKRKRSDEAEYEKAGSEQGGERKKVRVVGDEFVVQSLILGCLMDEE